MCCCWSEVLLRMMIKKVFSIKNGILFNGFKYLEIEILNGTYYIKYNRSNIADIMDYSITAAPENILSFTPGIFIHRKIAVFKTYNKLLKTFATGYFIKYIANKWTLCQEMED